MQVLAVAGPRSEKWRDAHESARNRLNGVMPPDWTLRHLLRGAPLNERVQDLINLVYAKHHISQIALGAEANEEGYVPCALVLDISQAIDRACFADAHVRSMCSGSSYYAFSEDRMLVHWEHLSLLGWNVTRLPPLPKSLTPHKIRELAGEAMAVPSITASVVAMGLCMGGDIWADR